MLQKGTSAITGEAAGRTERTKTSACRPCSAIEALSRTHHLTEAGLPAVDTEALQTSVDPVLPAIVQSRQNYVLPTTHLSHAVPSQFKGFQPWSG
jgi:hypothetical protein